MAEQAPIEPQGPVVTFARVAAKAMVADSANASVYES
jgi:hypothetical protein